MTMNELPSVGVVVPTHDRPQLLLQTLDSIKGQDYRGETAILVVFDKNTPDEWLAGELADRGIEWVPNARTPGLAGARNTGTLKMGTDLVAFCDDDDTWDAGKLGSQVAAIQAHPQAQVVTCGMRVRFRDGTTDRLAGSTWIDHDAFVRSRMAMVHSSTLLFRRDFLIDIGMVDETAPQGQNEDWDLLLRATRHGPILNVDRALVEVLWGRTSFFTYAYESKIEGLDWILANHPEIGEDPKAHARVMGQISYWQACLHDREARRNAVRTLREDPRQWRAVLALAVSMRLLSPDWTLRTLHKRGRGI